MGAVSSKGVATHAGCICCCRSILFQESDGTTVGKGFDCESACSGDSATAGPRVLVREKALFVPSPNSKGPTRNLPMLEQLQYVILVPAFLRGNNRIWKELPLDLCQAVAIHLDTVSLMSARLACKNWSSRFAQTCTAITVRLPPRPRSLSPSGKGRQHPPSPPGSMETFPTAVTTSPMPQLSAAFSSCSSLTLDTSDFRNACGLVNLNERISAWAGGSIRRLVLLGPPPQMSINCLRQLASLSELELINAGMIDGRMLDNVGMCTGLTRLVVSGRFQAGLRFSLQPWLALVALTDLRHLHLGYGEASFITLTAEVLRLLATHLPQLETLDFAGCVDAVHEPIHEALSGLPELSTLCIMHLPHLTRRSTTPRSPQPPADQQPGAGPAGAPPDRDLARNSLRHAAPVGGVVGTHTAAGAVQPGTGNGLAVGAAGWWDGRGDADGDVSDDGSAEPAFPQPPAAVLTRMLSGNRALPDDLLAQPRLSLPGLRVRLKFLRLSNVSVVGEALPVQLLRSLETVELLDCSVAEEMEASLQRWAAEDPECGNKFVMETCNGAEE